MSKENKQPILDAVVYIATRKNVKSAAWATATATPATFTNVTVQSGLAESGINEAVLRALESIIVNRDNHTVNLFTASPHGLSAAKYIHPRMMNPHVYTYNPRNEPHPLHRDVFLAANTHMAPLETTPTEQEEAPPDVEKLTVATDGSWSRFNKIAGVGVLTEDGRWAAQAFPNFPNPLAAELKAIEVALDLTADTKEPLRILCDSRPAIETLHGHTSEGAKKVRFLNKLKRKMANRTVELVWVKGHAGDILNEGADRLAVSARRNRDSRVDRHTATHIGQNIVREVLKQPAYR